jgi:hypothetical protein
VCCGVIEVCWSPAFCSLHLHWSSCIPVVPALELMLLLMPPCGLWVGWIHVCCSRRSHLRCRILYFTCNFDLRGNQQVCCNNIMHLPRCPGFTIKTPIISSFPIIPHICYDSCEVVVRSIWTEDCSKDLLDTVLLIGYKYLDRGL